MDLSAGRGSIMTDSNSGFWAAATAPANPREARARAQRLASQPGQPDPPPAQTVADPITVESMADYARNRDQILAEFGSGPRSGEWMGNVQKGTGRPALTASQMVDLGMGYGAHARPGPEPRPRGIDAAGHASIGGHPYRGAAVNTKESA
jgi:hypothetical protein